MSINQDKEYYFGIIDILTKFNFKKKIEFIGKRCFLGTKVSCIPPKPYSERFYQFLEKELFFVEEKMEKMDIEKKDLKQKKGKNNLGRSVLMSSLPNEKMAKF